MNETEHLEMDLNLINGSVSSESNTHTQAPKSRHRLKWVALAFFCGIEIGIEFVFSLINVLEDQIQERFNIEDTKFNLFSSVYSFPNILLPLIGGYLIDRIGIRVCLLIFLANTVISQLLFTIGLNIESYYLALSARFILGLGGENIYVGVYILVAKWFRGSKHLGIAMGLSTVGAGLADILNDYSTAPIYNATRNLELPFWVGFGLCSLSLLCGVGAALCDWIRDKGGGASLVQREVKLRDILRLNREFYIFMGCFFCIHFCINPFYTVAGDLFPKRFKVSDDQLGQLYAVSDLMFLIIPTFLGLLLDKVARRTIFRVTLMSSQIYFTLAPSMHSFLIPFFGMLIFGAGYSTYGVTGYPCIPLLVEEHMLGTAYGLLYSINNAGSAIGTLIVGVIHDHTTHIMHGYFWVCVFIASILLIGVSISLILLVYDYKHGRKLYSGPTISDAHERLGNEIADSDLNIELIENNEITPKNEELIESENLE